MLAPALRAGNEQEHILTPLPTGRTWHTKQAKEKFIFQNFSWLQPLLRLIL